MSSIEACSVGGGGGEQTAPLCEAPADVDNTHYSATLENQTIGLSQSLPVSFLEW